MRSHPSTRLFIIAIDGPSGAGKGTVARAVAASLGYRHVDTGAMYRALAWKAVHERLKLEDESALATLARRAVIEVSDGVVRVDGHDVKEAIRTAEIDKAAAAVARQPGVREVLIRQQREIGVGGGVVMEGRDIGTVVFPSADLKIYLDASPEERARRRATDPSHASGTGNAAVQDVASALAERDRSDSTRKASPLALAPDAVLIDTTGVPVDAVVQRVLALAARRR
ncbi:MAG: (d)CMP kinase [Acidobacteriota bacterium]|nr:(d)CMP kinase [Acidobacteriota bacterium]MDQ3419178.1 (d)CMP kinase [Acidobacteriota bacterium]